MELWDRRAGLTAALMVTVNATSIEYAQTARSYAMYLALATLSSVFFIRSLKRDSEVGSAGILTWRARPALSMRNYLGFSPCPPNGSRFSYFGRIGESRFD